jgi:hypothetical protein
VRRIEPNEGFTDIRSGGWIARREKLRRKDNPFNFKRMPESNKCNTKDVTIN